MSQRLGTSKASASKASNSKSIRSTPANRKTIVISLGGSIIVPDEIDVKFLKNFKNLLEKYMKKGFRFIVVCGGGHTCRKYQQAASDVELLHQEDLDWLGIHATRLNAHLMRTIFRKTANPVVLKDPTRPLRFKENLLIAAGWKPGWSTDYVTVRLANRFGAKTILNLSNQDYVYDKDPRKYKSAKALHEISWKEFQLIVGTKWKPGMNTPFDPMATAEAARSKLTVVMMDGTKINNLEKAFNGKPFIGTIIRH